MRSLGDVLGHVPARRPSGRKYRADAIFVRDIAGISTPLDRNQRAKLLQMAESIERRTKAPGRQAGIFGQSGLTVLRTLLLRFAHGQTGVCCPSIEQLRRVTGFCKQTVVKALRALEASGMVRIVRRLVRRQVVRDGIAMVTTVQGSNVYAFKIGGQIVIRSLLAGKAKSFPKPNLLMALLFQPGLRNRRDLPNHTSNQSRTPW